MSQSPEAGLTIDGFTLIQELHRGGFSTLWQVSHPSHPYDMVMKVPRISRGAASASIVSFEVEQLILPRLSGPHVARLIAQGDFDPMPYLVVERIMGQALHHRIGARAMPIPEAIDLAKRIAVALHDLHRQNVIHLDLKPENLMQRPTGEVVLIDFGLSRHDQLPDFLAEEFAIPLGTFPYIAPEQVLRQRQDLRSDLFALGVILYQMLTGQLPFEHPATMADVRKRLWRDPLPPRALRPEVPEWLQEITLRALEVDPAKRYQSAAQMAFDLANPQQLRLTARGLKLARDPVSAVLGRRWRMRNLKRFAAPPLVANQIDRAPILMVAVDLAPAHEALSARLFAAVERMLILQPDARVACINVVRVALDRHHIRNLLALKAWAQSLRLAEDRLTFSVLENSDPARALIDYATSNRVDHILMGARDHSVGRRFLGSVSARVVAEAACSVTVIRLPDPEAKGGAEAAPQA